MSAASASQVDRLVDVLGGALPEGAVLAHDPIELEGAAPTITLRPENGEELAAALRSLAQEGASALVRGGGSRVGTANAPARAEVLLETSALRGDPTLDLEEGVAWLPAGWPLAELRARLEGSGWELPLDPPGDASTVGGALASAAAGPRFAHPRDVTLGLSVTLGSGERTRCGGRVVKNVSGYDLVKLYLGSFGTLAVIEGAWLRLRPSPETVWTGVAPLDEAQARFALAAARASSARVAAVVDRLDGGGAELVLELAGDAPAVERDRRALGEQLELEQAPAGAVDALRALQGATGGTRLRVDGVATAVAESATRLRAAGARTLAFPGRGLVYALLPSSEEGEVDVLLRAARRAAKAAQGSVRIEEGSLALRTGPEVFGVDPALVPLHRALKRRYDPAGVLNRGRFVGDP